MLGCTPNFNVPYRPQQSGLCERLIGTLKSMISKVAADQPKMWHKHLGFVLWSIRDTPHTTTGIPPSMLVWGRPPRGPLAVLKGKDGKDGIRIAIDYRYLNKYCEGDAHPMPDIPDLMLRVWKSRYKSLNKIPWGSKENQAFQTLKDKLCEATTQPMSIADFGKPWILQVDASSETVGAALLQDNGCQGHRPIAFASQKLTPTQRAWSTIEKEAFAAIWALDKFRNWIFGQHITLYSDHNPLTYLTEATSKSPKLMRWALALQQYDVTFRYKEGRKNIVADCLSRLDLEN